MHIKVDPRPQLHGRLTYMSTRVISARAVEQIYVFSTTTFAGFVVFGALARNFSQFLCFVRSKVLVSPFHPYFDSLGFVDSPIRWRLRLVKE